MTITRTLAAAAILACAGIGCASSTENPAERPAASPAGADDFSGTYTVTYDDGLVRTWTATSCGPGCAEVEQIPNPFRAQARLRGNQWTMESSSPTGIVCHDDDSLHPGTSTWTWDAVTLRGSYQVKPDIDAACGYQVGEVFDDNPFSLKKS